MDKGKAIKVGLALILLVAAIVLIVRTIGSGGQENVTIDRVGMGVSSHPSLLA